MNQKDYKYNLFIQKTAKENRNIVLQLCDQFMIRRNYKTFEGFKLDYYLKPTALTVVQFINKEYFNQISTT